MKTIIVGGGAAGLAIGWRLAQAGGDVEIIDRGLAGQGAMWAAAGMLAPVAELGPAQTSHAEFARRARALWPGFAREVEATAKTSIGFYEDGALLVAESEARAVALRSFAQSGIGTWTSMPEAGAKEPLLNKSIQGILHVPSEAHVDNRALGVALRDAVRGAGAVLREHCTVHSLLIEDGRVAGVATSAGAIRAEKVVLAAGAWTSLFPGAEAWPEIKPIKGQIIAFQPPQGVALPKTIFWGEGVYLVPRRGRWLAGATVEDAGFDASVTQTAYEDLRARAMKLVPALASWSIVEAWAGLRPKSADGEPVLGESAISGLFLAGGLFRNGILFAPLVAEVLCRLVLGRQDGARAEAFDPKRFART